VRIQIQKKVLDSFGIGFATLMRRGSSLRDNTMFERKLKKSTMLRNPQDFYEFSALSPDRKIDATPANKNSCKDKQILVFKKTTM
jgi:hypothetical protein